MRRKSPADADDTVSYMLREIDGATWRRARVRAVQEQRDMSELLRAFIREYAYGKAAPSVMPNRRRK